MFRRSLIALSVLALLGAGCWSSSTDAEPKWVEPEKPVGVAGGIMGNWKIRSMKLRGQTVKEVSDLTLLVGFDGKKMNGRVCNSMSGDYEVNGIVLKATNVMSTKMFCEGDAGRAETSFVSGLTSGFEVESAERTITLKSDDVVFVLDRE